MLNLLVADSLEKKRVIESSKQKDDFDILLLSDIVYDFNVLNDIEFRELYFYFDESLKNKESMQEISRMLQVRQYYVLDPNSEEPIDFIIDNAKTILYGNIKADTLRKNVDLLYQNKISQIVRWMLIKNKSADINSIRKLSFKRAAPVVMGIIAEAEQKIIDFNKEDYTRVSAEYVYQDSKDIDPKTNLPKLKSFRVQCRTKFKEEHAEELELTLRTLRDKKIPHKVKDLKRGTEEKAPFPPLTTTRLQSNCFYLFDISPVKTISICEELCNGVMIDGVKTKLITSPFTEGYNISDDAILEINAALIKKYGVNYVLPSRRTFSNLTQDADMSAECIRPLNFSDKYFPPRLEGKLPSLHFEVYKFIFERTLSTQMKNSIYDASRLVIEVNEIELVANANKVEFDGWEKLDGYRQNISEDSEDARSEEVVFPKDLYIGKELKSPVITFFPSTEKNPPRYGKGRLLTTLVHEKLCRPEHAHTLIESMENAGLITEIQHMMHPQEIGMISHALFREYAPSLLSEEMLQDYESKISKVRAEEMDPEEVYHDYEVMKNDFEISVGYEENDQEPEEWMIKKAKIVAKFHGDILTDDNPMFYSKQMVLNYINAKESELEKIGRCPECKKEQVVEDSISFRCIDRTCKFTIYKEGKDGKPGGIKGFFDVFRKPLPKESYKELLSVLLKSNGKVYFNDLKKKTMRYLKPTWSLKKISFINHGSFQ